MYDYLVHQGGEQGKVSLQKNGVPYKNTYHVPHYWEKTEVVVNGITTLPTNVPFYQAEIFVDTPNLLMETHLPKYFNLFWAEFLNEQKI